MKRILVNLTNDCGGNQLNTCKIHVNTRKILGKSIFAC